MDVEPISLAAAAPALARRKDTQDYDAKMEGMMQGMERLTMMVGKGQGQDTKPLLTASAKPSYTINGHPPQQYQGTQPSNRYGGPIRPQQQQYNRPSPGPGGRPTGMHAAAVNLVYEEDDITYNMSRENEDVCKEIRQAKARLAKKNLEGRKAELADPLRQEAVFAPGYNPLYEENPTVASVEPFIVNGPRLNLVSTKSVWDTPPDEEQQYLDNSNPEEQQLLIQLGETSPVSVLQHFIVIHDHRTSSEPTLLVGLPFLYALDASIDLKTQRLVVSRDEFNTFSMPFVSSLKDQGKLRTIGVVKKPEGALVSGGHLPWEAEKCSASNISSGGSLGWGSSPIQGKKARMWGSSTKKGKDGIRGFFGPWAWKG
jgi:hypothetical protein